MSSNYNYLYRHSLVIEKHTDWRSYDRFGAVAFFDFGHWRIRASAIFFRPGPEIFLAHRGPDCRGRDSSPSSTDRGNRDHYRRGPRQLRRGHRTSQDNDTKYRDQSNQHRGYGLARTLRLAALTPGRLQPGV